MQTSLWVSSPFILKFPGRMFVKNFKYDDLKGIVKVLASVSNITIVCLYYYWQILEKLNSMSCYLLAYHRSVPHTRQLLLNNGKVLLGSLHLEKQFVGILMVKLFWRKFIMRYLHFGPKLYHHAAILFPSWEIVTKYWMKRPINWLL